MWRFDHSTVPAVRTDLPGPRARALLERDERYMSPSYARAYPLVVARGSGAVIEDVDGNLFLDFTAGSPRSSPGASPPPCCPAPPHHAPQPLPLSPAPVLYTPPTAPAQHL